MNTATNGETARVQTDDYTLIINNAGAVLFSGGEGYDDDELTEKAEIGFTDLLAIADFVNSRRTEIEAAQAKLEAAWLAVADEIITRLEEEEIGLGCAASSEKVQQTLHDLGPVEFTHKGWALSNAGKWYQSLFTDDGYAATFGLQWVPFLIVLYNRRRERFPERYSDGQLLEEWGGV